MPVLEPLAYPPSQPEHGDAAPAASCLLVLDVDAGVRAADTLAAVDVYVQDVASVAFAYFPVRLVLEETPLDWHSDSEEKDTRPSMATEQTFPSFQVILGTFRCYVAEACSQELVPYILEEERGDF